MGSIKFKLLSLHKKMKFFIKDFFSKCDQISRKLRICSHLLKKSSMENFIFCAVSLFIPKTKKSWVGVQKCQYYTMWKSYLLAMVDHPVIMVSQ